MCVVELAVLGCQKDELLAIELLQKDELLMT